MEGLASTAASGWTSLRDLRRRWLIGVRGNVRVGRVGSRGPVVRGWGGVESWSGQGLFGGLGFGVGGAAGMDVLTKFVELAKGIFVEGGGIT